MGNLFLGLGLGILSSLASWFAVQHLMRPKIVIAPAISVALDGDNVAYRIKIANGRRWRSLVDVHFTAKLRIRGAYLDRPQNFALFTVETQPGHSSEIRDSLVIWLAYSGFEIDLDLLGAPQDSWLDALMEIPESQLRVSVSATDSYSGVSRTAHHHYKSTDIHRRLFLRGRSVALAGPSGVNSN